MAFGQVVVSSVVDAAVSLVKQKLEGALSANDDSMSRTRTTTTTTTTITRSIVNRNGEKSTFTVTRTTTSEHQYPKNNQNGATFSSTTAKERQTQQQPKNQNDAIIPNPQYNATNTTIQNGRIEAKASQQMQRQRKRQRQRQTALARQESSVGRRSPCHTSSSTAAAATRWEKSRTTAAVVEPPVSRFLVRPRHATTTSIAAGNSTKPRNARPQQQPVSRFLVLDSKRAAPRPPVRRCESRPPKPIASRTAAAAAAASAAIPAIPTQRRTQTKTQLRPRRCDENANANANAKAKANHESFRHNDGSNPEPIRASGDGVFRGRALFSVAGNLLAHLNEKLRLRTTTTTTTTTSANKQ